jgi:hypothetical protein
VVAVLVAAVALAGCADDGAGEDAGTTSTVSLDPGVTFTDDVTVPSSGAPTTTMRPGEVVSVPNEVPEQFPANFPVPEQAEVEVGSTGRAEGELRVAVDYAIDDERPQAVFDFYRTAIGEAGFAVLLEDSDGRGQDFVGQLVFETDTYVGNVLVSGDGDRGVLLTLTATMPD